MTKNSLDSSLLLWTHDGGVQYSLRYFFSAILGCETHCVESDHEVWKLLAKGGSPSVLIVHHGNDAEVDLHLIRQTRERFSKTTVIGLYQLGTSLGAEALLCGADDAMVWPGSLKELFLRVSLRHGAMPEACLRLVLNSEEDWEEQISISKRAGLTVSEAQVLAVLLSNTGDIVTRDDLSRSIDGKQWNYGDRRFDVHVASIRKKLAEVFGNQMSVNTVRSQGYQLKTNTTKARPHGCA